MSNILFDGWHYVALHYDTMQIMNAITFDLGELPAERREALQREAMRRECSIDELIHEALTEKSERIMTNARKRRRRGPHTSAA